MKRLLSSSLALTLGISAIFGLQIVSAQTFPTTNPPGGNIAPHFSGVTVDGDTTVGGFLKVGNNIKPKSGISLGLDGHVNITKGLDVTGDANLQNNLAVQGNTVLSDTLTTSDFALQNIAGVFNNTANKAAAVAAVKNRVMMLGKDASFHSGKYTPELNIQAIDTTTGQPSLDGGVKVDGYVNANGSLIGKSLTTTGSAWVKSGGLKVDGGDVSVAAGGLTATKVGTWSTVTNSVNLKSYPIGNMVAVLAKCPSGAIATSCQGYFFVAVSPSDRYLGSNIITSTNGCEVYGQRDAVSAQDVFLVAQAMCFDPSK
ncbi:MAG: hypothetical protein AAB551_03125 [Patescibacteria group bacterium]